MMAEQVFDAIGIQPSVRAMNATTPGSRSPDRVLITTPPNGVKHIVVSTLRPPRIAARLDPLPRCAITTFPSAAGAPARHCSSCTR